MDKYLQLAWVFLLGITLGAFFFGGLWWTVNKVISSKRPTLMFLSSLLMRIGLVLSGFYIIGGVDSLRLVICLSGFACARFMVMRLGIL